MKIHYTSNASSLYKILLPNFKSSSRYLFTNRQKNNQLVAFQDQDVRDRELVCYGMDIAIVFKYSVKDIFEYSYFPTSQFRA